MKRIILAALVGVLVSGPVWGLDKKGQYLIIGAGGMMCPAYLGKYGASNLENAPNKQLQFSNDFARILGWLEGYATRVNQTTPGEPNIFGMDQIGIAAWVASWCRDNPSQSFIDAMIALTNIRHKK